MAPAPLAAGLVSEPAAARGAPVATSAGRPWLLPVAAAAVIVTALALFAFWPRPGTEPGPSTAAVPAGSATPSAEPARPAATIAGPTLVRTLAVGVTGAWFELAVSPDGVTLATVGSDKRMRLWDRSTGRLLETVPGVQGPIVFNTSGDTLAAVTDDGVTIKIWNVAGGWEAHALKGHRETVSDLAFAPDGVNLAAAAWDGTVITWDTRTGAARASWTGSGRFSPSVGFTPDGRSLVVTTDPFTVRLADAATLAVGRTVHTGTQSITDLEVSPDGRTLAVADVSLVVRIVDLSTGQTLRTLPKHASEILDLSFRADSGVLATAVTDGSTVRLWDVGTGAELATISAGAGGGVAFSQDGKSLVVAGADGKVRLWAV